MWSIIKDILNYNNIKKLQELINNKISLFKTKLQKEIEKLNESIEMNSKIANELSEKVGS